MNQYLLAVIGLLVIFIIGAVFYRFAATETVRSNKVVLDLKRFVVAGIGMYVMALAFIYLFHNVTMGSLTGVSKGLVLGLLVGIVFWGIPFYADADYLKGSAAAKWIVFFNWVVALAGLGIVIGALA